MRIAITGATGFVGGHLAHNLHEAGHETVAVGRRRRAGTPGVTHSNFVAADLSNAASLEEAFAGCAAVAHCAGINREIGSQTYERVHVEGTRNVVEAAKRARVRKITLMSFLRARPGCGSKYHESKWAAEEIVRGSGLDYTVIKAGMVFGRGDHMLDHLSHSLHTMPLLATVGLRENSVCPLAIDDLVRVLRAALTEGALPESTVALTGPEQLLLSAAVRRVARVVGKRAILFPAPVWFHYILAQAFEWTMRVPLVAKAQVKILSEGVVEPATPCVPLPCELAPTCSFDDIHIRHGLPKPGPFTYRDLRCCYPNAG